MTLKKFRVLVTRPRPQGEALCEEILVKGWSPLYLPTIEIKPPTDSEDMKTKIKKINQFDWLIFTSLHAVSHSIPFLLHYWEKLPVHLKIAAIGQSTAKRLEQFSLSVDSLPLSEWSSEGLLELSAFHHVEGKSIAIVTGEGGRNFLEEKLLERKAKVTYIFVYKREIPHKNMQDYISLLQARAINAIVSASNDSLKNLMVLFGKENKLRLNEIPLMVVSQRIADYASELGFKMIFLAKNANHHSIVEALDKLKKEIYGN